MGFIRYQAGSDAGFPTDYDINATGWYEAAQRMLDRYGIGTVAEAYKSGWFGAFPSFSAGDSASLANWINARHAEQQDSGALDSILGMAASAVGTVYGGPAGGALAGMLTNSLTGAGVVEAAPISQPAGVATMDFRDVLRAIASPVLGQTMPQIFGAGAIGADLLTALTMPTSTPAPAPVVTAALPGLPALGSFLGGVGTAVARTAGVIRSVGGRILGVILPSGVKITRAKAVSLAKTMGVQGAATALGIGAVEMAEMVMAEQGRRGRSRGVSGAALKTTRRTMRTVEKMHRQIAGYCRDAGVRTTRFVRAPAPAARRCR